MHVHMKRKEIEFLNEDIDTLKTYWIYQNACMYVNKISIKKYGFIKKNLNT